MVGCTLFDDLSVQSTSRTLNRLTGQENRDAEIASNSDRAIKKKWSHIEGNWLLRMIEDGKEELRIEVCPDSDQSAKVLVSLLKKHNGSTIYTGYWRVYDCLSEHGFIHKKVIHSDPENPFVAEDETHTQRITIIHKMIMEMLNFYEEKAFKNQITIHLGIIESCKM